RRGALFREQFQRRNPRWRLECLVRAGGMGHFSAAARNHGIRLLAVSGPPGIVGRRREIRIAGLLVWLGMQNTNLAIAARFFNETCNARKLETAEEIFSTGHAYHDPSSPWVGTGPDGMKSLIAAYQTAFPDAHWAQDEVMESGDTVITRWTGSGTHQGPL